MINIQFSKCHEKFEVDNPATVITAFSNGNVMSKMTIGFSIRQNRARQYIVRASLGIYIVSHAVEILGKVMEMGVRATRQFGVGLSLEDTLNFECVQNETK